MKIVLDRGHGDKGTGTIDPGVTMGQIREIDLADAYMFVARSELERAGHEVLTLYRGSYDDRHRQAVAWIGRDAGVYVQCHVNAGAGTYGLIEHDARSTLGAAVASHLATALATLPGVSAGKTRGLTAGERGWVCIDGIWSAPSACGVIFEPFFIDHRDHAYLRSSGGISDVGRALAAGLCAYAAGR